jgi:ribosomal protein S6E (S10)
MNGGAEYLLTFNERDVRGANRFNVIVERPGPAWRAWRQGWRKRITHCGCSSR